MSGEQKERRRWRQRERQAADLGLRCRVSELAKSFVQGASLQNARLQNAPTGHEAYGGGRGTRQKAYADVAISLRQVHQVHQGEEDSGADLAVDTAAVKRPAPGTPSKTAADGTKKEAESEP